MGNRSSYPPGTRDLKRGASTLVDRARAGDLHTTRMDLQLSAAHLRFRNELRAWLAATLPRPWREGLRDPRATETRPIELRRARREAPPGRPPRHGLARAAGAPPRPP